MTKEFRTAATLMTLAVLGIAGLCLWTYRMCLVSMHNAQAHSFVASVASSLHVEVKRGTPEVTRFFAQARDDWHPLSSHEVANLLGYLAERHVLDTGRRTGAPGKLDDPWGQAYRVWFRLDKKGDACIRIFSLGADGVPETKDDIIGEVTWLPPQKSDQGDHIPPD